MDPWWIFLGFILALSGAVTASSNRTLSSRSPDSGKSGGSGESRSHKWESARREDPADHMSRRLKAKCVDIPQTMSLCRGIGYLKMRLPNLLGHETLGEVQQGAVSWTPLLSIKCSTNTQLFLCSLFSPVCLDQPIWPCRSLCLEVKRGCEAPLATYGYPWPEMLNCEKLPSDNDLCIGIQSNRSNVQDPGVVRGKGTAAQGRSHSRCRICQNISSGLESVVNNFCEAEFVARIKPDMSVFTGNDLKLIPKKKAKFLKSPTGVMLQKRRQAFFVPDGAKCDCFNPSYPVQYLVMGHVTGKHRMVLTSATKIDVKSESWRKAVRNIKKADKCPLSDGKDQKAAKLIRKKGKSNEWKASTPNRKKKERKNYSDPDSHKTGNRANTKREREPRKKESTKGRKRRLE